MKKHTKSAPESKQSMWRILKQQIKRQGWQALWVVLPANRRYLTGFSGSSGWVVVPAEGQIQLITDGRYVVQAHQECPGVKIADCGQDPHKYLAEYIQQQKIRQMGYEEEHVTVGSWRRIQRAAKGMRGKSASGCVEALRICKTKEEQHCLQRAVRMAETAFARIKKHIKVNMREIDIALILEQALMLAGAEGLAFPTIVASGPNSAMPHAQPGKRRLRPYDLVVIDFGCKYKGYHSDLTRTIAIDKMNEKQQELYKIVKKAQDLSKKELFPGKIVAESDKKARAIFKAHGLEKYFIHSLGHGLGLEIHEAPKLSFAAKDRLEQGMVVTCEPGIYLPGWGGIRIEDDVLITANTSRWLSRAPAELPLYK